MDELIIKLAPLPALLLFLIAGAIVVVLGFLSLPPLAALLLFFLINGMIVLVLSYLLTRRRAPIWPDKIPLYTSWAGGRVGALYYREPLINFVVYNNLLIVNGWQHFTIHFANIERIELENTWLGLGTYLKIVHHEPNASRHIRLTISDQERIKAMIDARLPQQRIRQA